MDRARANMLVGMMVYRRGEEASLEVGIMPESLKVIKHQGTPTLVALSTWPMS